MAEASAGEVEDAASDAMSDVREDMDLFENVNLAGDADYADTVAALSSQLHREVEQWW